MFVAHEVIAAHGNGVVESDDESLEKYKKLLKTRKLFKSLKLAKSGKKLSKSGNSSIFNAKKIGSSFLISDTKMAFNYLYLTFTKAPIFQHFDSKCHI